MNSHANLDSSASTGRLLAILTASFYVLFTLLPNSNSLMVSWPWVFIWQVGLLCPVLWLLGSLWVTQQVKGLGLRLDWVVGLAMLGIAISTAFAQFPQPARWYGWAALCYFAALYALNYWLDGTKRRYALLINQGYLNLAFIAISLVLWTAQTLLPELSRLNQLKQAGVNVAFDFSAVELRNWVPIGHQNYVAGYLLLALPLLVGLAVLQAGWRRWLWVGGVGLGLLNLYTTSSRGGWLGLLVLFGVGFAGLLWRSRIPRRWLELGGIGGLGLIVALILANNRSRSLIVAVMTGQGGGELAYRWINTVIGWRMGNNYPLTGVGLGNVVLLYQKYRPFWAGRESELAYQLHSTPAQLWAEMSFWGILAISIGFLLLIYYFWRFSWNLSDNRMDSILLISLFSGLLAYGVMSLTDYQLDNVSISGTLIVYMVCIASILRIDTEKQIIQTEITPSHSLISFSASPRLLTYGGLGLLFVVIVWLIPIHRAWQLSNLGFSALNEEKIEPFVKILTRSHQLAPWESYYSYQLGWNLGNIAQKIPDTQIREQFLSESVNWFLKGNKASPFQEFGQSSLGWLQLGRDPKMSTDAFIQSIRLVPAKRGVFYGLGLSLLVQAKTDLAIEAFALEGMRDLLFISSPVWKSPNLSPIYPQILERMVAYYTQWLKTVSHPDLKAILHRSRGGVFWWQGNFSQAHDDLDRYGTPLSQSLLAISEGKTLSSNDLQPLIMQAWNAPAQRRNLLERAWIQATNTLVSREISEKLLISMDKSDSFYQWLTQNAPDLIYRRQRLGFGVLSRHIDGVIPLDFWLVVENMPINTWFSEMLPSPFYAPELDRILQPLREELLEKALIK